MPGAFGSPYRPPCPGTWPPTPQIYFEPIYQHWRDAEAQIPRRQNALDVSAPGSPDGNSYSAYAPLTITAATNASPIQITVVEDCSYSLSPLYGSHTNEWVKIAGVFGNTSANGIWHVTLIDAHNFTLDGSAGNGAYTSGGTAALVQNLARAHKWTNDDGVQVGGKYCYAAKVWHGRNDFAYDASDPPDIEPTRYLRIDVTATREAHDKTYLNGVLQSDTVTTADGDFWANVSQTSGRLTAGGAGLTGDSFLQGVVASDISGLVGGYVGGLGLIFGADVSGYLGAGYTTVVTYPSAGVTHYEYISTDPEEAALGSAATGTLSATELTTDTYAYWKTWDDLTSAWITNIGQTGHHHILITPLEIDEDGWAASVTPPAASGTSSRGSGSWSGSGTLSSPYTWEDLESDVDGLLSWWSLADDQTFVWEHYVPGDTNGPLVTYNEFGRSLPNIQTSLPYTDTGSMPRPWLGDGAMVGLPLTAGSDPFYDYGPKLTNGAEVNGLSPVQNATQWFHPPDLEADWAPPGGAGWSAWHQFTKAAGGEYFADALVKCKCAVIRDVMPSYNFFRPCEADRDDPRFPSAWPIGGRRSVAGAVQAGGNVTITLAQQALYLRDDDYVDFSGVSGLGSNLQVSSVSQAGGVTTFQVAGTLGTYLGAGHVMSHGAPSYGWYDDNPKGDFVWQIDNPSGVSLSQDCLPLKPCCVAVCAVTPNAETFCNGKVKALGAPSPYTAGARLIITPILTMADPLYAGDPPAPQVEARVAAPTGAPALPGGFTYGLG